ncbi:MAG: hypothetical protein L0177_09505 [Chloroflexi bacterium]|nr:hypothetical protein [Chloroflexota bacterium]
MQLFTNRIDYVVPETIELARVVCVFAQVNVGGVAQQFALSVLDDALSLSPSLIAIAEASAAIGPLTVANITWGLTGTAYISGPQNVHIPLRELWVRGNILLRVTPVGVADVALAGNLWLDVAAFREGLPVQ